MHFHVGLMEFLVFALYYFILKAVLMLIHLETRRARAKTPAAVTGLFS
jgi:hypothetical protein